MKRTFKGILGFGWLVVVLMLALASSSGAPVSAAGTVPNDIPATAAEIDGQPHQIAGESALWYKFDYGVSHSEGATQGEPVMVTLSNGNTLGMSFGIYPPDQILNWWEQEPVGRGTPQLLSQGNLPMLYRGDHLSNDLLWVGRFPAAGTYYVRVKNENAYPVTFTLFVEGAALR